MNKNNEKLMFFMGWLIVFGLFSVAGVGFLIWVRLETVLPDATEAGPSNTPVGITPQSGETGVSNPSTIAQVPNVPEGIFNYGGSTTFAPLRSERVLQAIETAHPGFKLRYYNDPARKPGSGTGISMLIEGQLSFSQSSRAVKTKEFEEARRRNFEIKQVPVAIDGIAFYVNRDFMNAYNLQGITLAEARDIFTGEINNWKEVGGPDLEIVPFSRNLQAGGTVDFFYEKVLEKQDFGSNVLEVRDTTDSIRKVAQTTGGIGYATASEIINQSTISPLRLAQEPDESFVSPCDPACQAVNQTAFGNGSYPLTRRLFVVIKLGNILDREAGEAYVNMLLSDEGQKLIEEAGFVPLR